MLRRQRTALDAHRRVDSRARRAGPARPGIDFATVGLAPLTATNPPGTEPHGDGNRAQRHEDPGARCHDRLPCDGWSRTAGKTGTDITDANGEATFTYTDTSAPPHGTDTIQAFIGALASNTVSKTWALGVVACDIDGDTDVDLDDLALIRAANKTKVPAGTSDPRDANGDKRINVADVRYCTLKCTRAGCAK